MRPRTTIFVLVCMVTAAGCSNQHYKKQADKEVYNIIDNKWKGDFGGKVNYRVSDVEPAPASIELDSVPLTGSLSLAEAVTIATANNRDYQTQKELLYTTALDLTGQRHEFSVRWFGTFDPKYTRNEEEEYLSYDAEAGFGWLLAEGGQIGISLAVDWMRFLTGDPRMTLGSVLAASIRQPLLRGAGKRVAQENLTQTERDVLYQIRSFNRYRKTFVVSVVNDYYRVLQQLDGVKNAYNNYQRRVESKERLEMEAAAGRRPRFEVDQAEQNMLTARDNYISARQRYQQSLDNFKLTLAIPTDADVELLPGELDALADLGVRDPNFSVTDAMDHALISRLDLANTTDRVIDAERKVLVAADALGAELNLVGSANVPSTRENDFERLDFHLGTYNLGFEAELPLDRKLERNSYRRALITHNQRKREYLQALDEVKLDVRQAFRDLEEAAQKYDIQKNSLELAEKRVESTTLLLKAGRVTTRDLLEAQDALLEAQNNLTAALVNHTIAKLSFYRDIGLLRVRPDGMWTYPETAKNVN